MHGLIRQWIAAPPLRMKIRCIVGHIGQRVIDLVVAGHSIIADVFNRDAGRLSKRHLPIGIKPTGRIDRDRQRTHITAGAPAVAKKIAHRCFDRRGVFAIPIHAQNRFAPLVRMHRHPDLLDGARPFDFGQRKYRARRNRHRWRDLPAAPQIAPGVGTRAIGGHPARTLFAGKVLCADGTRFGL